VDGTFAALDEDGYGSVWGLDVTTVRERAGGREVRERYMRLLVVYIRTQEYMVVRTRLGCSTRLAERKRLRHRLCKAPALVRSGPRVGQ